MALSTAEIVAGIGVTISAATFLWNRFGVILGLQNQISNQALSLTKQISDSVIETGRQITAATLETSKQIAGQDKRLATIELKMELFWSAVSETVKEMIKQPTHYNMDQLIDKFPNLEKNEICELRDILVSEMPALLKLKHPRALAMALLLARIDQILLDRTQSC